MRNLLLILFIAMAGTSLAQPVISNAQNPIFNKNLIIKDSLTVGDMENDATQNRIMVWDSVNMKINYRQVTTLPSGAGATDLSFSGASSPVTLNSSTGTDVNFVAGTNITLAATGTDLTINSPDYSGTFLKIDQTTPQTVINGAPNFGAGISLNNGSAAAPSYSFTGDTDNGIYLSGTDEVAFAINGIQRMRLTSSGKLYIGSTASLGGTLNIGGSGTTSSSSSFIIQDGGGTRILTSENDGKLYLGSNNATATYIAPHATVNEVINKSGANISFVARNASTTSFGDAVKFWTETPCMENANVARMVVIQPTFAPTSGVGQFINLAIKGTINQTGGANGITRGVYVNETLTAASDWRAIETTAGQIIFTDPYSAGSGSLARSTLTISPTWNTSGTPTAIKLNVTNTASGVNSKLLDLQVGGTSKYNVDINGKQFFEYTYTAPATTGAQTINKVSGSVNFAAAATSLVVTNSLVTTNSIVQPILMTNDATAELGAVVVASGSFTIYLKTAPTAETKVGFIVFN